MKHLLITFLIICSFFLSKNKIYAQSIDNQTSDLNAWIDSQFTEGMKSSNIPGASIVLMQGDSILHMNGYGLADIDTNTPVNGNSSIFCVGSVSKTFIAAAAMRLVEKGRLELDRDVNRYLTSFQLEYQFNDSITVRHLLTHTAGLDNCNMGTSVREEEDVIPLAYYLKEQMPSQIRPSGQVITYSNQGYALLGLIVEEVSGQPCYEYVREKILKPLEMHSSGFKRQAELKDNYVTSYWQKHGQLIPYQSDFKLNYPAGALNATASDMGHYISMFLNNGHYKGRQILDSATVAKMFHTSFRHYEKAEYGRLLGFSEQGWYGLKLYGHTGTAQGFNSQLTLIPEKKIGLFISVNSGNHLTPKTKLFINQFTYDVLAQLMPESMVEKENAKVSPAIGSVDEPLEAFTGKYRYSWYGFRTLEKLGILIGLAPEIEIVKKDNTLEILQWNDKLIPFSDLTFHSKYGRYLAFDSNAKGKIAYFFAEAFSYHKLKWYEPVKFQMFGIGSIILILLIYIIASAVRQLFVRNKKRHLIKGVNFSLSSFIVLFLLMLTYALKTVDPMEFFYGIPLLLKIALVLPFLIIPLEFIAIYLLTKSFRFKELGTFDIIYQSIIVVAVLLFIPWLMYYNLIGFNY